MAKRINTLNTASSPANDDYLPIDGATNGTRKISADFINNLITDVEVDGTSVVTSGVAEIDLSGKQDTLTAGSNITIAQDGTISATDTTYTAGTNVDITGGVISATDTTYTAGANITIDANNEISATDTTYTAGTNVQINNGVISATDTTYSAFTGATSGADGSSGLVPQPLIADKDKFLKGDGTWDTIQPGASALDDLTNVDITSPTNGQVLKYDSTNQEWVNANESGGGGGSTVTITPTLSTGTKIADYSIDGTIGALYAPSGGGGSSTLSGLSDVTITSPTDGQGLIYDATNQIWVNGNVGGGGSAADELTLAEYNALTTAQKNDGTIRFIPAGSGGGVTSAYDMSSISSSYVQGEMRLTATSSTETTVEYVGGQQIGCNWNYPTPIDVTNISTIHFKATNGSCYGGGTQAQQSNWSLQIGLTASAIGNQALNITASDSRWAAVADMPLANHVYEGSIDVSELTGSYYLLVVAHGWNTVIEDITLDTGGAYPSQIKYMSKTYAKEEEGSALVKLAEYSGSGHGFSEGDTITLSDNMVNYDVLMFATNYSDDVSGWINGLVTVSDFKTKYIGRFYAQYQKDGYTDVKYLTDTTISVLRASGAFINAVYGIKFGGGGGSGVDVTELTQSEYNALPDWKKNNGCIYMVSSQASTPEELTEAQTNASTAVTASSYMYDTNLNQYHYAWCAFNRVSPNPSEMAYPTPGVTTQTCWSPNVNQDGSNSWICYHFDRAYKMTSMTINSFTDYSSSATKSMIIEGSNDGTTWTNILLTGNSFSLNSNLHTLTPNNVNLNSDTAYEYVRLRSLEPMGASYQPSVFIDEIFVYGYKSEKALKKIYYMGTEYGNTGGSSEITYSTTEHQVGTWIDGSDVYEKTISINNVSLSSGSYETVDTITGLDTIISCNGYVVEGNLKYTLNDLTLRVVQDGTNIKLYSPSGTTWTISSGAIIIRYIKVAAS